MKFTDRAARSTDLKTLEQNSYFAHPENVLLSMLSDVDYQVGCMAINKILAIREVQEVGRVVIPADVFEGGDQCDDHEESHSMATMQADVSNVRRFHRPKINNTAKVYHKVVNMNWAEIKEPPAIKHNCDENLAKIRQTPLKLQHPCHNQAVERHIKVVTEASAAVSTFERKDGVIRQKLKSQKLIKKLNNKCDYFSSVNAA